MFLLLMYLYQISITFTLFRSSIKKTVSTSFSLNTDQQTSIGFLINITDGSQLILQANKIRMFRLESFFD